MKPALSFHRKNFVSLSPLIIILLLISVQLRAQKTDEKSNTDPAELILFQSDEILDLNLHFDRRAVIRDVGEKRSYHPALLNYTDKDGDTVSISLKIRTRGHFRRDPVNCNFPPIMLNFKSENTKNTVFEGVDKLKLVTHCKSRRTVYEQYILKEYLVYRLYNLFTEESFRVRLTNLVYVDSTGNKDPLPRFGFFIEPEEFMSSRNNAKLVKVKNVLQYKTDREKMLTLSVFQYLIGNTDWSVPALHNIRLLQDQPGDLPVAVPYDFDWCGLVAAPYAIPAPTLEIHSVQERLFRGFCQPEGEYLIVFQDFINKREEIYALVENFSYLEEKYKKQVLKYLDSFYKTINNPKMVKAEFYAKCRNK